MCAGRGHLGRPPGAEERLLRAHLGVHNILHNPHTLPRVCAQGERIYWQDNLRNRMYYCGGNEISLWEWAMITKRQYLLTKA